MLIMVFQQTIAASHYFTVGAKEFQDAIAMFVTITIKFQFIIVR